MSESPYWPYDTVPDADHILTSQVFLILSHAPLVRQLAEIIFNGDISLTRQDTREMSPRTVSLSSHNAIQHSELAFSKII